MTNSYSFKDVEKMLISHPKFSLIKGTYLLSQNTNLQPFTCSEKEFHQFIKEILEAVLSLSSVNASDAPKEWAPLPEADKEQLLQHFQEATNVYQELLKVDPHIVVITKIKDAGRSITWNKV